MPEPTDLPLLDRRSRPLRDLRISVTDRCNFRCAYCMPREAFGPDFSFLPREAILTFEEITRLASIACRLGVRKIRITGGEPLLRKDLPRLVEQLAKLPGIELALTTNGSLLESSAAELAEAGLHRVTVSLDTVDEEIFARMSDTTFPMSRVLSGINAAAAAGLSPVKINAVIQRGVNDHKVLELARHFRGTGHIVRFIEYMDVGTSNRWQPEDVVPAQEILRRLATVLPLEPLPPTHRGEVARRYGYTDGSGEIGIIASVTLPFCQDCSRARLSAQGRLYTCLYSNAGTDLRGPLRTGESEDELERRIRAVWSKREDRYSEIRFRTETGGKKIEMSYIGG